MLFSLSMNDIYNFLKDGIILREYKEGYNKKRLKIIATRYVIIGDFIHKIHFEGTLILCLKEEGTSKAME